MSEEKKCPCCSNHCDIDSLRCGRGRDYFSQDDSSNRDFSKHRVQKGDFEMSKDEKVISRIRQCGHLLHHNDGEINVNFLDDNEKDVLIDLLSKCLEHWK